MKRSLVDELSELLGCNKKHLTSYLHNPIHRQQANDWLRSQTRFRTNHLRGERPQLAVRIDRLTVDGADKLPAYNGFCNRMTVRQHFFGRHRIKLLYYKMPCAIVRNWHGSVDYYYPLEVLSLIIPGDGVLVEYNDTDDEYDGAPLCD